MKKCRNCKEEFEGRLNKVFCSLYCKSAYNYEKDKNKPPTHFKIVDKQLKLNRNFPNLWSFVGENNTFNN